MRSGGEGWEEGSWARFRTRDKNWAGDSLGFRRDEDGGRDKDRRVQGRGQDGCRSKSIRLE
jgi:hypothetical protein